jgi:hypothetical protein
MQFGRVFEVAESRIEPVVTAKAGYPGWGLRWWQYWRPRPELVSAIQGLERVIVIALTSKVVVPVLVANDQVFSHAIGVFAYGDYGHFGLLSSAAHWWWALTYSSTLETRIRYTPSDVFETFPQPETASGSAWSAIEEAGESLDSFRTDLMVGANIGLTKTYNRVHNADDGHPDVVHLRELHVQLDHAVRDAYGWSDLDLAHRHWETPHGVRFTVGPEAKDELLDRLLELNHQRYSAEVAAGLHTKKAKKAPAKRAAKAAADPSQETLL